MKTPYNDIMVDIETLDTSSNAVVVSIGAVKFNETEINDEGFYAVLSLDEQGAKGRIINPNTVSWWMGQDDSAKDVFKAPKRPVLEVLEDFTTFVGKSKRMWGNGADFDCVIVGSLYESFGMTKPWSYANNRCYRTLKNIMTLNPGQSTPAREGVAHNALHDAIHQAKGLQVYLKGKKVRLG